MEKYFDLYNNCKFVKEENNGCLYDTLTGKMYELDAEYSEKIDKVLKNKKMNINDKILIELVEMGLGTFVDHPVIHENAITDFEQIFTTFNASNKLEDVYIQLVNECNNKCVICEKSCKIFSKTHCKLWEERSDDVKRESWEKVFKDVNNLGAKRVNFIGGNPFLNLEKLKCFVTLATNNHFEEIIVYANVNYISEEIIRICKENHIKINIQLMDYNQVVKENITWLLQQNIDLEISVLVGYDYEQDLTKILQEISSLGIRSIRFSEYYHSEMKEIEYEKKISGKFDEEGLRISSLLNTCLYGKIYITMDGDVMPCPMLNSIKLGSIKDESIVDIIKKDCYQKLIFSSRSKIQGCRKCVFRFNCKDCRAIEAQGSNDLLGGYYCTKIGREVV